MVTFECKNEDCDNANVAYNFLGSPETAMCGGCKSTLEPKDLRDDPPEPTPESDLQPKIANTTNKK